MAFVHEGQGGGPLLLLRGYPETKRIWWRNIRQLADFGFEVIAPDLRGFGDSSLAPDGLYDPASHSQDIHALIRDVLGHDTCVVMGGDLGAVVAYDLSLRFEGLVGGIVYFNTLPPTLPELYENAGIPEDPPVESRLTADYFVWQGQHADARAAELDTPERRRAYLASFYTHRLWAGSAAFAPEEIDFMTEPFADADHLRASWGILPEVFDLTSLTCHPSVLNSRPCRAISTSPSNCASACARAPRLSVVGQRWVNTSRPGWARAHPTNCSTAGTCGSWTRSPRTGRRPGFVRAWFLEQLDVALEDLVGDGSTSLRRASLCHPLPDLLERRGHMHQHDVVVPFIGHSAEAIPQPPKIVGVVYHDASALIEPFTQARERNLVYPLPLLDRDAVTAPQATLVVDVVEAEVVAVELGGDALRPVVLLENTELAEVTLGPLGSDAADGFNEVWTTHMDLFVEYARAVRSGDADAREETREDLARWADDFATTMGDAGGEAIEATVVEEAAVTHLESMIGVIEEQQRAA